MLFTKSKSVNAIVAGSKISSAGGKVLSNKERRTKKLCKHTLADSCREPWSFTVGGSRST